MKKLMLVLVAVVLAGCVVKKRDIDRHIWPFRMESGEQNWYPLHCFKPMIKTGDTLLYSMSKDTTREILEAEFERYAPCGNLVLLSPVSRSVFWNSAIPPTWIREGDIRVLDILRVVERADTFFFGWSVRDSERLGGER